jgi:hypothetical protein
MKRFVLLLALIGGAEICSAAVMSDIGKIGEILAYDQFGEGDVRVNFATGKTECPNGVWISPSSPGFNNLVSFALAAQMGNRDVKFQLYETAIWSGSDTQKFCKAKTVQIQP